MEQPLNITPTSSAHPAQPCARRIHTPYTTLVPARCLLGPICSFSAAICSWPNEQLSGAQSRLHRERFQTAHRMRNLPATESDDVGQLQTGSLQPVPHHTQDPPPLWCSHLHSRHGRSHQRAVLITTSMCTHAVPNQACAHQCTREHRQIQALHSHHTARALDALPRDRWRQLKKCVEKNGGGLDFGVFGWVRGRDIRVLKPKQ